MASMLAIPIRTQHCACSTIARTRILLRENLPSPCLMGEVASVYAPLGYHWIMFLTVAQTQVFEKYATKIGTADELDRYQPALS